MDALLAALADPARWRLVTLLAERPRSVGVLAQLAGARQPQTTKHLQTLERAGLVTSERTGQRRIYVLRSDGSGVRQITFGSMPHFLPRWRPTSHFTPAPAWAALTAAPVSAPVRAPASGEPRSGVRQCFGMVGTVSGPVPCDRALLSGVPFE